MSEVVRSRVSRIGISREVSNIYYTSSHVSMFNRYIAMVSRNSAIQCPFTQRF